MLAANCAVCVSPALYLHYCHCSITCKSVLYCTHVCLFYCQLSVLCVSPVLCLHYCQHRVLCLQVLYCVCTTASAVWCVYNSCVVSAQCTASAVCRAEAKISPLIIILFCFLTIPTSWEWMSTGFSIITAS